MSKEKQNIEWKQSWRDEYIKWLCGFANAQGGTLIIGRNDAGDIVGVADAKKLLEEIPNKVRDILGIMADVHLKKSKGLEILEIKVESSPHPVSYKGQYHYRSGSTKQELKGAALDAFLLRKMGKHWDSVPIPHVGVGSLSKPVINHFRQMAKQSRRLDATILKEAPAGLLEKLNLMDGKYLKRAAILLFHPDPEKYVTGAFAKIGYFRSNTDLLFQDEIHGDLFTQVEKTLDILTTKYLKAHIRYEGIQRVEELPVPEAALREAVLNALVHKNYATGVPVQISVYADKLLIWNSAELPPDWTIEKLFSKHASIPYNPDVANAFFRSGMIESWGRGIERIVEACRSVSAPDPQVRYETSGLWVEFIFPKVAIGQEIPQETGKFTQENTRINQENDKINQENAKFKQKTNNIGQENSTPPQETKITTQETIFTTQEYEETTQEKILSYISINPSVTRVELTEKFGLKDTVIKYLLHKMKSTGLLKHMGSTKAGYWVVINKEMIQTQIIDLIKSNPAITRLELADMIGLTSDGIKYHLQKLKTAGIIKHVGSTKAGHWEILKSRKEDET